MKNVTSLEDTHVLGSNWDISYNQENVVVDYKGNLIASAVNPSRNAQENEDIAKVIAVSPDMLRALRHVHTMAQEVLENPDGEVCISGSDQDRAIIERALIDVRDVLQTLGLNR